MIIYLLTFKIFDDITHANHSATSQAIFTKMHVTPERLYFYLRFALGIIHCDRCGRKHKKQLLYSGITPFLVVTKTITLFRNIPFLVVDSRFDVILTSVTINKHVFLRKLFCYESFVDIDVSKK